MSVKRKQIVDNNKRKQCERDFGFAFFQPFPFLASLKGVSTTLVDKRLRHNRQLATGATAHGPLPISLKGSCLQLPIVSRWIAPGKAISAVGMTSQSVLKSLGGGGIITPSSSSPTGAVSGMCEFLNRIQTRSPSISLPYTERPLKRALDAIEGGSEPSSRQSKVACGEDEDENEEATPTSPGKSYADSG